MLEENLYVYLADVTEHKQHISNYWDILSSREQENAQKFCTPELSGRYIVAHGILRQLIAHITRKPVQTLVFSTNTYGKPHLEDNAIHFNMSHSENKLAYIFSTHSEVGIDIEVGRDNLTTQEIAYSALSQEELRIFLNLPSAEQNKYFYKLWTMKEALLKAVGCGLNYDLKQVNLLPNADRLTTTLNNKTWNIVNFPSNKYYLSFASSTKIKQCFINEELPFDYLPARNAIN